jgi:signal transduction histidine kinase
MIRPFSGSTLLSGPDVVWHSQAMHGRTGRLGIAAVGTVILVGAEVLAITAGEPARAALLHLAIGLTYLYGGLAIWDHAPANRTGMLMTAVGLAWWVQAVAKSGLPVWADLANMLYDVPTVLIFALVLAYPSGRLETRADRIALAVLAVASTALNVIQFVPAPLLVNEGINGLFVGVALVTMTIVMILRRWVTAPGRSRRVLSPVLVAGMVLIVSLSINLARRIFDVSDTLGSVLVATHELAPAAIPIALLIGFFRQSEYRMQALIDAIPDRIIRIGRDGFATNIRGTGAAPGASATDIAVAQVFDAMSGDVDDVAKAATRRALDDGGLQAFDFAVDTPVGRREFEARLTASGPDEATAIIRDFTDQRAIDAELRRSRARIVEVADAERRRLERDLHDGAQQRLVALSLSLRLLRTKLHAEPGLDPGTVEAADSAAEELRVAIAELRELARGIHPVILTEAGLGQAIASLAERSIVPAIVTDEPDRRLPSAVEATAYFVVSEALANTAKHAAATRVAVGARCLAGTLHVEISDDGVGGADRGGGTGIEGLHDRVAALGGTLTVDSPPGQGTLVVAEIPFT